MPFAILIATIVCLAAANAAGQGRPQAFERLYGQHCAVCHGDRFEGTAQGNPLVGAPLVRGEGVEAIAKSIAEGATDLGMPAWSETLGEAQIRSLAILIAEERANATFADFRMAPPLELPDGVIQTERHGYRLTKVIGDLEPLPYSIAPLPDGRILLTEKMRGLTVVSADGTQSELVSGAPVGNRQSFRMGPLTYGVGWILDVALHPDYAENGWIYLSFGDRCTDCGRRPTSMIKLIRGRLADGAWVDEETVYQAAREHYNPATDMAAGGRIAFDGAGHVFLSLGMKGGYGGIQDLGVPHGKIHRLHDDGRVPDDNPFADAPGKLPSIWDLRTPQRARSRGRPSNRRAMGHGDGTPGRRRDQPAQARRELRLAVDLERRALQRPTRGRRRTRRRIRSRRPRRPGGRLHPVGRGCRASSSTRAMRSPSGADTCWSGA